MESKLFEILEPFSRIPFIEFLGAALNRLGKGDALAFLCILLILYGFVFGRPKALRSGSAGILLLTASGIVVQSLKHLIGRARPQEGLGPFHLIGPNLLPSGFDSFPSGHALSAFALAAFMSRIYPRFRWVYFLTAAAISIIGRVLFRHHFLSDVIAGAILGALLGLWSARRINGINGDSPHLSGVPRSTENDPPDKWGLSPFIPISLWERVPAEGGGVRGAGKLRYLWIGLFASVLLFTELGASALWDRDETEYAQAVLEMRQKGEWLIPTLEGEPFIEKPILLFWLVRLSYKVFGVNEFSSRAPSAVFGVLTCLATAALADVFYGPAACLWAGLSLASMFLFAGGFRLLLTDPFFVFFSVLTFLFYALSKKRQSRSLLYLFAACVSMGFSLLSKGPIGFFPAAVIALYEWAENNFALNGRTFQILLKGGGLSLVSAAIAAPWFIHSFSRETKATSSFFLYDNLARFTQGTEGHTGPAFYHIVVLALGCLPWTFLIAGALRESWKERSAASLSLKGPDLLLGIWILAILIFFSLSATKLPHYMFPALPPLAVLLGKHIWRHPSKGTTSLALCGVSAVLFIMVGQAVLPRVESRRVMKPIALSLRENAGPNSLVYGFHVSEPSLFFYSGRIFPRIEHGALDDLLGKKESVFVITDQQALLPHAQTTRWGQPPKKPYKIVKEAKGFSENGGRMTLVLLSNEEPSFPRKRESIRMDPRLRGDDKTQP